MCVKLGLAYSKRVIGGNGFFFDLSVQMPDGPLQYKVGANRLPNHLVKNPSREMALT